MNKLRPVKGQRYPDTRELINGYAEDYWVRNPTPETIKQLWTQGQPSAVLSQYLMDGTYFYLYVNTDCDSTTTIFKSVPKEMVQQMEALLDRMPEITRKWNGVSQHTFSLNGAEPSLNTLRLPSSAELSMMAAPPEGTALTMSGDDSSPLKAAPEGLATSPSDSACTSDDEEDQGTFYDSDEGAPPLQSETESE
jgi:hypothetical protein